MVKKLIEQINTPGQHALLYGDRGVGKSSLANVTAELLLKSLAGGKLYPKRCDSQDAFETILAEPLRDVGIDLRIAGETRSQRQGGSAGVEIPNRGERWNHLIPRPRDHIAWSRSASFSILLR